MLTKVVKSTNKPYCEVLPK